MNITVRLRPLPTHPLTLPATLETRATVDILGQKDLGSVSGDPTPQLLNHPPVILVHPEGGEALLNRDAVVCQLQLIAKAKARVPNSLVVYTLEESALEMSLRSLQFLYGQLQPLHYKKKDSQGNSLAELAANKLKTDRALYSAIAQGIFGSKTLAHRHCMLLFAAANLGDKSIRNLELTPRKKGKNKNKNKKEKTKVNTSLKETTVVPMINTTGNKNTTVVPKKGVAYGHSQQEKKSAGATHPPCSQSLKIVSTSDDRKDHQLDLGLIEEDA